MLLETILGVSNILETWSITENLGNMIKERNTYNRSVVFNAS